ncbi:hypothetical protein CPC08DRAFT_494269 [Agrocybe pediades]|nr:hypothetical protein CPC08DRAFT_494269 [Agrocybe pediades]
MLQFSLFPDLHTIDLLGPETDGGATIIPTVIQFLEHRVLTGSPLFVLDLSSFDSAALSDTNKEHLDKIPGLSVILPGDYSGWYIFKLHTMFEVFVVPATNVITFPQVGSSAEIAARLFAGPRTFWTTSSHPPRPCGLVINGTQNQGLRVDAENSHARR